MAPTDPSGKIGLNADQAATRRVVLAPDRSLRVANLYDLLALALLALALPALLLLSVPILSVLLGLIAVLMAPGYGLAAAVFVRADDIDGIARAAISFGLSLTIVPLLALALNFTPWGIKPWPISLSLSLWLLVTSLIAGVRRGRLLRSSELTVMTPPRLLPQSARALTNIDWRVRVAILLGGLLLAVTAYTMYIVLTPGSESRFTEFYALGAQRSAVNYPRDVVRGSKLSLMLGVNNRERVASNYVIMIRDVNRTIYRSSTFRLRDGQRLEQPIGFRLNTVGDNQEIDIFLFRDVRQLPYRQLRLWINVH